MQPYTLWFIAAILLFVLEIITPGFVLLWFGVGALVAAVLDLAGIHSLTVQVLVFAAVSVLLVTLSRTIFKNVFVRSSPGSGLKTNTDALIDKVGFVTETIDNDRSEGRIVVDGQDWLARSEDGSLIEPHVKVRVVRYEGARLIVVRQG